MIRRPFFTLVRNEPELRRRPSVVCVRPFSNLPSAAYWRRISDGVITSKRALPSVIDAADAVGAATTSTTKAPAILRTRRIMGPVPGPLDVGAHYFQRPGSERWSSLRPVGPRADGTSAQPARRQSGVLCCARDDALGGRRVRAHRRARADPDP